MSAFYEEQRANAQALLAEFGRDITFIRYQATNNLVAGTTARVETGRVILKAAVLPASGGTLEAFDVRFFEGVNATANVRFAIVAAQDVIGNPASIQPAPNDVAEFDGVTWLVMGNTPLNVDGTAVLFSIGFRQP